MRRKILSAAVLVLLSFSGYCFFQQSADKKPGPEKQMTGGQQQPSEEIFAPQAGEAHTETAVPAAILPDGNATLNLSPGSRTYLPPPQAPAEVTYLLQKSENKERTLMPGITYRSGEGINIAMDEDEKIQIRRDSTYHSKEVQIM